VPRQTRALVPVKPSPKAKPAPKEKAVYVGGILTPKEPRHVAFCQAWLGEAHFDHVRAARLAGYSDSWIKKGLAKPLLEKYQRYLLRQKEIRERAVAKEIALEQRDILQEMMAIAFCNAQDYVVKVNEPVKNVETGEIQMLTRERQKPMTQLTRLQAAAISEVTFNGDGTVTYKLPGVNAKHPYLKDLAQHIGMLHPKLIQEHRHEHLHRALSFASVPDDKLAELEQAYLRAIGPEGRRQIGIIDVEHSEEMHEG
jgi:hypothetical protein